MNGVQVIDISDVINPHILGIVDNQGEAIDVAIKANL